MAIIKCKMCGGDIELSVDKTFGNCEYCGSTMTFPKIDDEQRAAAFNRGNHFRRIGEFDKALAVYERIVQENNSDAEAHWCCALCRFGIEYVEDPDTYEWLPTCHRASFDSFIEDVDYLAALDCSDGVTKRQYQKDAAKIADVQRGILATSQNEEPFDVFICYKESDDLGNRTVDSTLAQDIYYQLTEQGRRVFFARITLEDKAGSQFEPYIFAALNSAKVMVTVGTKPEYFNAVWVKNEWSRYLAIMKKDHKKLLIPCYRDMDPYDLPEQLSVLQSYDMGRIGFIQDLIRGVAKVLDADKKPDIKETVVVQNEGRGNITALLKRGNFALEDGAWDKADDFYEQVLNLDAECAEAYLGKALAAEHCVSIEAFMKAQQELGIPKSIELTACPEDSERIESVVAKYQFPMYIDEKTIRARFISYDRSYLSIKDSLCEILEERKKYFQENKFFNRALRYAAGDFAISLKSAQESFYTAIQQNIDKAKMQDAENVERIEREYTLFLDKGEQEIDELYKDAVRRRESDYAEACNKMEQAKTRNDFDEVACLFINIGNYKDSEERARACRKYDDYAKACDKMKQAETMYEFREAAVLFFKMGSYMDSEERAKQCQKKVSEMSSHYNKMWNRGCNIWERHKGIIYTIVAIVIAVFLFLIRLILG